MKTGFLTAASHELRTPLNAIIGYGELIREELGETDPYEIASVRRPAARVRRPAAADCRPDPADTNLEAGATQIRLGPVSMPALLADVARSVARGLASRENTLGWSCPDDLGLPRTDPTLLRSVLFNLVENADKFTQRGRVTVVVRREGPLLVVAVADTGIGMSAAEVARLFQPFTQLESGFTRGSGARPRPRARPPVLCPPRRRAPVRERARNGVGVRGPDPVRATGAGGSRPLDPTDTTHQSPTPPSFRSHNRRPPRTTPGTAPSPRTPARTSRTP